MNTLGGSRKHREACQAKRCPRDAEAVRNAGARQILIRWLLLDGGKNGPNVEVTFTKWVAGFPALAGITGGDVAGAFAGAVLSRDPFDNGTIVKLEARYEVTAAAPAHSFVAHIEGTQNNQTQQAVLNGTVVSGWLAGAQVHVTFDIIAPIAGISCVPEAPVNTRCFQGTIRVMPSSAN